MREVLNFGVLGLKIVGKILRMFEALEFLELRQPEVPGVLGENRLVCHINDSLVESGKFECSSDDFSLLGGLDFGYGVVL